MRCWSRGWGGGLRTFWCLTAGRLCPAVTLELPLRPTIITITTSTTHPAHAFPQATRYLTPLGRLRHPPAPRTMSANALPITLTRFASALSDLPIDAIYAKHTELRNNVAHMEVSNVQLEDFARENDDRDCYEALMENRATIKRFEERIVALQEEVVARGLRWRPVEEEGKDGVNGVPVVQGANGEAPVQRGAVQEQTVNGVAAAQEQRADAEEDEGGVHL
jgi:hypothetical protein